MQTLLIAVATMIAYLIAYHTYGRWLATKIFRLDASASVPSIELNDDRDFVPTNRSVLFGHHFTSIAGTGPIVGPAIAVMWGWLPALVWVLSGVDPCRCRARFWRAGGVDAKSRPDGRRRRRASAESARTVAFFVHSVHGIDDRLGDFRSRDRVGLQAVSCVDFSLPRSDPDCDCDRNMAASQECPPAGPVAESHWRRCT